MTRRMLPQMFALPISLVLLCSTALRCDKQPAGAADLAPNTDLASSDDLASADDLASRPDLLPPADLLPPPDLAGTPGDRCQIALPLPTDNTLRDGTTVGFSDDYQFTNTSPACATTATSMYKGKDVTYAVAVPAGKTLTVTLTPKFLAGTWYPMLALLSDCAQPGPSCLGAQDTVTPNSKDRVVTYQNSGATDRNLFVLVDTFDSAGSGQYAIKAALN